MALDAQQLSWKAVLDDAITPILERIAAGIDTLSFQLSKMGSTFQVTMDDASYATGMLEKAVSDLNLAVDANTIVTADNADALDANTAATDANATSKDANTASTDANTASTDANAASSRRGAHDLMNFGLIAAAAAAGVIYLGAQADDALTRVAALTGATPAQMEVYTQAIEDMAGQVGMTVTNLANGLYDVISAGFNNTSDALTVMHYSAELAATGMVDLHTVTEGVTKIMVAYNISGADAASVTDALTQAVKDGNVPFSDFSNAIGLVAQAAQGAGYTFDEAAAALSALTRVFPDARRAGQDLQNLIVTFSDHTDQLAKNAEKLGLSFDETKFKTMSLHDQLAYLMQITGGNTAEIEKIIPNVTAWKAAQVLLGNDMQNFNQILGDVQNSTGATDTAFKTHQQSIGAAADELGGKFSALATKITDLVKPEVTGALNTLATAVGNFSTAISAHMDIVMPLLAALGALIAGGLAAGIVALALSVGSAIAGISGFVLAIGGAVAVAGTLAVGLQQLWQHSKDFRDIISDVAQWVDKAKQKFDDWLHSTITPLGKGVYDLGQNLEHSKDFLGGLLSPVSNLNPALLELFGGVSNVTRTLGNWLPEVQLIAQNLSNTLTPALHSAWQILQQVGQVVQQQLGPIWQQLVSVFENDLVPAWNAIVDAVTPLLPILELVGQIIGGIVLVQIGTLLGLLVGGIRWIGTFIQGLIQFFGGLVRFVSGIFEVVTAPFGFIVSAISDLIHGKGLQGVLDDLQKMFEQMRQGIMNIIGGLGDAIIGTFKMFVLSVWNLISGFVSTIIGYFQHLFDQLVGHSIWLDMISTMINTITGLPGTIGGIIWNLVQNFLNTLGGLKDGALSALGNAWNAMVNLVGGWANSAVQWGTNLIQGFINGIKNMAGKVADAVSGIAKTVAKFLGFGSPTEEGPGKTLDAWGPNLVKGFADGIASTAPAVAAAAQMIATTLAKGMTQPVPAPGANTLGAGVSPLGLGAGGGVQQQNITFTFTGGLGAGLQMLNSTDRTTFIRQIAALLAEQRGLQTIGVQGYAGR